jgi:hypothetical protein
MTFATRRLAALAVMIAMLASLATAGMATAASSTITQQDCAAGTIKDKNTGEPISRARCEALVGKNVQLASTGFDLRPVMAGGALLLLVAAGFGVRRRSAHRLA